MTIATRFAVALACSTALMPAAAIAQAVDTEQDALQDEIFEDENAIIVTATRRAENVQDIPIAVTAVSPVQLERQGVVNVQQLTQVSPSFSTSNAQNASGTVVLRIRGIGTTSNNIGFESAVGIFIDGAYQSRPGVALSEFVDVERVEVLRGPQGTLFGRNTSAGALNITNVRPDLDEFGGFANASYGNYDLYSVQGAVNVPIVPGNLAARLTGAYRERDGYVDVVNRNGVKIGESNEIDQFLVRGQLGFETDGGINGRIIGDYSENNANCCQAIELLRSPRETDGSFARVGTGPRGGMAGRFVAVNPFDTASAQDALDDLTATANFPPTGDLEQWGVTGEVELPLGDLGDLIYVGSYRQFSATNGTDSDYSGLDVFNTVPAGFTDIDTMTHELRLQGDTFGGRLSYLFGAYYSTEDIEQEVVLSLGSEYDRLVGALFGGAVGPAPLQLFSGGVDPTGITSTNRYTQDSESFSIFTHNTLELFDGFDVTIGLRYSDETKNGGFTQPQNNNNLCPAIINSINAGRVPASLTSPVFGLGCFPFVAPADLAAAAVLPLPRTFQSEFNDSELIYTGKIAYAFADPINVYASFTHGYKSGGFNLDSTAAIDGADPRFASEEVDAYEVGLKSRFLNNAVTLNMALFLEDFTDFQVLEFTGAQFQTFNVPKAQTKGFELETLIRPDDHLTVNAGLTYVDADYPDDCAGDSTNLNVRNLCGNSLTNAPKLVTIVGATYRSDVGRGLAAFVNGQIRAESDRRTSTQARAVPATAAGLGTTPLLPFDVQDGNVKINLRVGVGNVEETLAVEAFVTNLTDVVTRGVTFNTVLRSGSRSAFPQEPRMYGVTVRGKF